MWAFVAVKGGEALAEDVGKSVSLETWGLAVHLKVSVAVKSPNDPGDHTPSSSLLILF